MATGKIAVTIDSDDLVKGITTSSNLTNGGFSPESVGINLSPNPGVIYPASSATNIGALDGRVVATTYDNAQSNGTLVDRYIVTDHPSLYSLRGGSLHQANSSLGTASNYIAGGTDAQVYGLDGSGNPIVWIVSLALGMTGQAYVYGSNTSSSAFTFTPSTGAGPGFTNNPHPMLIFNKTLFIADGNLLHTILYNSPGSFTNTSAVLTLQADQVITSLGTDPGTGRMLVGISSRGSLSAAGGDETVKINSPAFVGLYDGTNPTQLLRKVPVDSTVTAFYNCGGVTNVMYGDALGYFAGSGITFIRKLYKLVTNTFTTVYKHKITNIDNILFYVSDSNTTNPFIASQSNDIVGYGEIVQGTKSFFNFINVPSNVQGTIDCVFNVANNAIAYAVYDGVSTYTLYQVSYTDHTQVLSTGDASPVFVSARVAFPRPSIVNQIRIFFEDPVTNNGAVIGNLSVVDDKRIVAYNKDISNPSTSAGVTTYFDIFPSVETTECQVKYQWKETVTSHGIQKIMLFYTPYE